VRYWANLVACQRQSQLQLRPIATTIASCKHPVRGLTKPPAASVLRPSSWTLSYLYTSRRCGILLCVSNLRRVPVFCKCSFLWHSAYFHSALYPSFRRKNPHCIFRKLPVHNFPHAAFRKILPATDTRRDTGPWHCSSDGTDDETRLIARRYVVRHHVFNLKWRFVHH